MANPWNWISRGGLKLPNPLRPYQWEGVQFLVSSETAMLADEMGLGKTVQVAVALEILLRKPILNRALVVAPASLKLNWETELRKWAPTLSVQRIRGDSEDHQAYYNLPINVLVVSYEDVRSDINYSLPDVEFDVVVLDEAQRIKNPDSQTALACYLINRDRSWVLTGTPVENRIDDLVSIFRFVKDSLLHQALSKDELHSRIRPYFLRRRKKEVAKDLPSIIQQQIPLLLEGSQREAYMKAWLGREAGLRVGRKGRSEAQLLALITSLKQLCNYDPQSGQSAKLDALRTILESQVTESDKVIVFSQYVETLKWVSSQLQNVKHDIFHGGLTQATRAQILNRFRTEPGPRVLFISLRAGGVGLNIQEASTVVLFDRWWNPAVEDQAIQRAHRYGRTKPLHAIRFLVQNTIEERIAALIQTKQALFEEYVEAAPSASAPRLDKVTLEAILELLPLSQAPAVYNK